MSSPVLVWFRQDLRLDDNPALHWAVTRGAPVIPVYILDDETDGMRPLGGASKWWLEGSLAALTKAVEGMGSRLILRRGPALVVLQDLIDKTGTNGVVWNRLYDPGTIARDTRIKTALKADGLTVESFNGAVTYEPWEIETKTGGWYKVYTRYWQANRAKGDPAPPVPAPENLHAPATWPRSETLDSWSLRPTVPDWAAGLRESWTPGEAAAQTRLSEFLREAITQYGTARDFPARPGTSRLAASLHFGEISPRRVWHETIQANGWGEGTEAFLKELIWREFATHVLYHYPALPDTPLNERFNRFPWADDDGLRRAWQRGQTGYPIVDAGMRELWQTGTMHNRVRMIVGSFLVKHLLQPWQSGEAWFWDTLVDADLASNSFNWQWIGGSGADAVPYFRIFNPMLQGEKFDKEGAYIRRWVPELRDLPDKFIHQPWEAPELILRGANVSLGKTYPKPIVDHKKARDAALAAFKTLKA